MFIVDGDFNDYPSVSVSYIHGPDDYSKNTNVGCDGVLDRKGANEECLCG